MTEVHPALATTATRNSPPSKVVAFEMERYLQELKPSRELTMRSGKTSVEDKRVATTTGDTPAMIRDVCDFLRQDPTAFYTTDKKSLNTLTRVLNDAMERRPDEATLLTAEEIYPALGGVHVQALKDQVDPSDEMTRATAAKIADITRPHKPLPPDASPNTQPELRDPKEVVAAYAEYRLGVVEEMLQAVGTAPAEPLVAYRNRLVKAVEALGAFVPRRAAAAMRAR